MKDVIKTLTNHRSFRQYTDKMIEDDQLAAIIKSAQLGPSWIHSQQVSVVAVKDKERKVKLAKASGNQAYIEQAPVFLIFCADFHRAHIASKLEHTTFEVTDDVGSLLVGATDVGIALSNTVAAAELLGLGTVPIGGVRKNPLEVIDILKLPKYVIPIVGLCIGYGENDPGIKPHLPKEAFYHEEAYNENQTELIEAFNKEYENPNRGPWTDRIANFYKQSHYNNQFSDVPKMLKQQGFTCKDMV